MASTNTFVNMQPIPNLCIHKKSASSPALVQSVPQLQKTHSMLYLGRKMKHIREISFACVNARASERASKCVSDYIVEDVYSLYRYTANAGDNSGRE